MDDLRTYRTDQQLVDRFGRSHTYLRISVTDRCNLRCAYCLPDENITWKQREELLTEDEIVRLATISVRLGITKIRITGGEPLVRPDIASLASRLKSLPGLRSLAMTTNGVLLADKLPLLRHSIDALNISLDTFRKDRYRELTGRDVMKDAISGIQATLAAGYRNLKVNVVVMRGVNDTEIIDFVRFTSDHPVTVRFIEFMPFAANHWSQDRCVPMNEIVEIIGREYTLEALPEPRSLISRDFTVRDNRSGKLHTGRIGIIASMSRPFCNTCSRLRITAEGMLMPCLHSTAEFDLRSLVRNGSTDEDIVEVLHHALLAKPKEHLSGDELAANSQRVMIQIGG